MDRVLNVKLDPLNFIIRFQVHIPILPILQLQVGIGIHCTENRVVPQLVHRPVAILTDIIKDLGINDVIKNSTMNGEIKYLKTID